jgi:coniferyl-aldehyde dehydrogenase
LTTPAVPAELHRVFLGQRHSYDRAPFPEWPERQKRLQRLRSLIVDHERSIEDALDADFGGRPRTETQVAEIYPSLAEINNALRKGRRWMKPRRARVSKWFLPASARIVPRPLGVAGIIVPWNYPLYLAIGPLVAALVAGNRAMVKMSEYTPVFSELFRTLVARSFRPDEVAVITGGAEIAAQFSALSFDHLLFTGSASVGRKVMAAAAANLTPVTLELGGKSPAVVTPGYPIASAVERVLHGKLINAGQTCIAPDYILVPRGAVDAFIAAAQLQARRMYPGGIDDRDYCSIINERQYTRLVGYLAQMHAAGVAVVPLFDGRAEDAARRRLAPTLLIDPPRAESVMCDEIFGPLLPVVPYDRVEDALAQINALPRPLALYWFDNDHERAERAVKQTHAGGVCINETMVHVLQEDLPFGGIGPSGINHYHGKWGFDTFSKLTPVFWQSRFSGLRFFMPPYRPLAARLLALMKRY